MCVCERERESVCVCDRERVCVCVRHGERERVCVCETRRERECVCVCARWGGGGSVFPVPFFLFSFLGCCLCLSRGCLSVCLYVLGSRKDWWVHTYASGPTARTQPLTTDEISVPAFETHLALLSSKRTSLSFILSSFSQKAQYRR